MIRKLNIFLFFLFIFLTSFGYGQDNNNPDYYFNTGANLYIEDKSDEALAQVITGLEYFPGNRELTKLKELLEKEKEEQEQQQKQDKNQEEDKEQEQEKQEQEQQQQEQEQKEQEQQQQQQQQQQEQQNQQEQQQQQQPQPQQISKQDAERMLEALKNDENKTLEKVQLQKVPGQVRKVEKDW